jgi:hypothetical protein
MVEAFTVDPTNVEKLEVPEAMVVAFTVFPTNVEKLEEPEAMVVTLMVDPVNVENCTTLALIVEATRVETHTCTSTIVDTV